MNNKIAEVGPSTPSTKLRGHHGHSWMMIGCAVMLALVLILVATGSVGATLLLGAAGCIAMMAVMVLMMSHGMSGHDRNSNG